MVMEISLHSAEDLRQFMHLAMQSADDVGVHTSDGKIADAKSILGLLALDFQKPVKVVSENPLFFKTLKGFLTRQASQ